MQSQYIILIIKILIDNIDMLSLIGVLNRSSGTVSPALPLIGLYLHLVWRLLTGEGSCVDQW